MMIDRSIRNCLLCGVALFDCKTSRKYCPECAKAAIKMTHKRSQIRFRMRHRGKSPDDIKTRQTRFSGKVYENTKEYIEQIKEKYRNGVPCGEVERWLELI